jgi:hypothetical protein
VIFAITEEREDRAPSSSHRWRRIYGPSFRYEVWHCQNAWSILNCSCVGIISGDSWWV